VRRAKVDDHWNTLYKRNYDHFLENVNLNGVGGIEEVIFKNGIFAICGLNGAGKSTIISALKDLLGIKINSHDIKKINGKDVEAQITINGNSFTLKNSDEFRFIDKANGSDLINYLDYKQSMTVLDFLQQDHLDELLEQFDENVYNNKILVEINYIVGKQYDHIVLVEIDDGEQIIPYFNVRVGDLEYNSLSMGIGEHFLFYIYWVFSKLEKNSILLIEEPETFISINSQNTLMNFIAKKTSELGLNIILATHSPYIIKNIRKENICIVSRYFNTVSITSPSQAKESLFLLGLDIPKRGCMFVEDYLAELFLKTIVSSNYCFLLNEFNIEKLNGESEITKRLEFPNSINFSYKIIGVYDGDMKSKMTDKIKKDVNWGYCYLPTDDAIEVVFRKCLRENLDRVCSSIHVKREDMIRVLSSIDGEEHHDWFSRLCTNLGKDIVVVVNVIYHIWEENQNNKILVQTFLEDLLGICDAV
jgi:predicted ATPase